MGWTRVQEEFVEGLDVDLVKPAHVNAHAERRKVGLGFFAADAAGVEGSSRCGVIAAREIIRLTPFGRWVVKRVAQFTCLTAISPTNTQVGAVITRSCASGGT